jgi:hypothetical protein
MLLPRKLHPEEASKVMAQIKRKIIFIARVLLILNVITMG